MNGSQLPYRTVCTYTHTTTSHGLTEPIPLLLLFLLSFSCSCSYFLSLLFLPSYLPIQTSQPGSPPPRPYSTSTSIFKANTTALQPQQAYTSYLPSSFVLAVRSHKRTITLPSRKRTISAEFLRFEPVYCEYTASLCQSNMALALLEYL